VAICGLVHMAERQVAAAGGEDDECQSDRSQHPHSVSLGRGSADWSKGRHGLPPEQRQKQNNGQRNTDKPEQRASTERHKNLLSFSRNRNFDTA
jgi:hypothetical protein